MKTPILDSKRSFGMMLCQLDFKCATFAQKSGFVTALPRCLSG